MKKKEVSEGMLVSYRGFPDVVLGKVISKCARGVVLIELFAQSTRHYMGLSNLIEFPIEVEPDDGKYHAWAPKFKGCHTEGKTIEEARQNAEYATRAYLRSMLKHNEVKWDSGNRRYYTVAEDNLELV